MVDKLKHSIDETNSVEDEFYRAVEMARANRAVRKAQSPALDLIAFEMEETEELPRRDMGAVGTAEPKTPHQNPMTEVVQILSPEGGEHRLSHKEEMDDKRMTTKSVTSHENVDNLNQLTQPVSDAATTTSDLIQCRYDDPEECKKRTSRDDISRESRDAQEREIQFEKAPTVALPRREFGKLKDQV